MNPLHCFSDCYETARHRFVDALNTAGFSHEAHAIDARGPTGDELTIDVGVRRSATARRSLVISSGLHGVEGFFGSAVQLALLEDQEWLGEAGDTTVVMIHALNPFGFAWKRRWNEDNVDLNRSFFTSSQERPETLPSFHRIDAVLNPRRPAGRFDFFPLAALWFVARYGFAELQRTLPIGQYDNPLGLFYGGHAPSRTQRILEQNLPRWVGPENDVLHLDFHTGLGRSGDYALLLGTAVDEAESTELHRRFGPSVIESSIAGNQVEKARSSQSRSANSPLRRFLAGSGIVYPAHGLMSAWLEMIFPSIRYLTLSAEFGTYPSVRVLQSLITENRAYHWDRLSNAMTAASCDLMEMFAPSSPEWRAGAIADARKICNQAVRK